MRGTSCASHSKCTLNQSEDSAVSADSESDAANSGFSEFYLEFFQDSFLPNPLQFEMNGRLKDSDHENTRGKSSWS